MHAVFRTATLVAGSTLLAILAYGLLALPGLVSDRDSTVPLTQTQHAQR